MNPLNPLIVQSDMSILLEVMNPQFEAARDELSAFAELEKSPEYMHSYKVTPLSLWNAASSGITGDEIVRTLAGFAKHALPENVVQQILDYSGRYGKVKLMQEEGFLFITCGDSYIMEEIRASKEIMNYSLGGRYEDRIPVNPIFRGHVKQALIKLGYPADDLAGYDQASAYDTKLTASTAKGEAFVLREYQKQAVEAFYAGGAVSGGSGVVVLPCGAGKTIVGISVMEKVAAETLILTTGITALRQWKRELMDKTLIPEDEIGEYSGESKEIKPITIATYQILTSRRDKESDFLHFEIFNSRNWGLIIYDEVHMLPAPILRMTAEIQAKRRVGLTATLIREDGLQRDVFSLIGPKKFDMPWKALENDGFIAQAFCSEIRVPLPENMKMEYAKADGRKKFRIAAENVYKQILIKELLEKHRQHGVLIIGQYIEQLTKISEDIGAPVIMGSTKSMERERLYAAFRSGEIKVLIVSKVGNFAIDLPDANVLIEVSGMFGSRQEEAQRLGRILRPKAPDNTAWFYSIVTHDSKEQEFAAKRQLFLTEQGYQYVILHRQIV